MRLNSEQNANVLCPCLNICLPKDCRKNDIIALSSYVETPLIFATPLNTTEIVGKFTQSYLVCDTLLCINNVRWAILHHMMYTPLELSGIPQAWVILEDENAKYFEEIRVSNEFEKRLTEFRTGKKEREVECE